MLDIVLDSNVLVSALRSRRGASFALLSSIADPGLRVHISTAILLEYEEVCRREASAWWAQPGKVEDVLNFICKVAYEHPVFFRWRPFLRDPDDEMVLELAISAGARYIVTHNARDFLGSEGLGVHAISPRDLLTELRRRP